MYTLLQKYSYDKINSIYFVTEIIALCDKVICYKNTLLSNIIIHAYILHCAT